MTLHAALTDYLATRRALGFKLTRTGALLAQFVAALEARGCTHVTTAAALTWAAQPRTASPRWWATRLSAVRRFAQYVQTRDTRTEVPPPDAFPFRRSRAVPYVYSAGDLAAVLAAAQTLRTPLKTTTYQTLISLLAVTGMRVGEAVALDDGDVDRRRAVLVIRKSKFRKSREVPLHPSSLQALARYRRDRDRLVPHRRSPSFFVSIAGTRLLYQNVHETFLRLIYAAGLGRRQPRPTLHDLRHSSGTRIIPSPAGQGAQWPGDHAIADASLAA